MRMEAAQRRARSGAPHARWQVNLAPRRRPSGWGGTVAGHDRARARAAERRGGALPPGPPAASAGGAGGAQGALRLRGLPPGTGGGHRRGAGGQGRAVRAAHGRRQEPVLPAARAHAPGPDAGGEPADRLDEGPGGRAHAPRHRGGRAQQHAHARGAGRRARPRCGGRGEAALRGARALQERALPAPRRGAQGRARGGGRGALHQPVGGTTSGPTIGASSRRWRPWGARRCWP